VYENMIAASKTSSESCTMHRCSGVRYVQSDVEILSEAEYEQKLGHCFRRSQISKIALNSTLHHISASATTIAVPTLTVLWLHLRSSGPSTGHFYANCPLVHCQKSLDHLYKLASEAQSPRSQKLQSNKQSSSFSTSRHKGCMQRC